MNENLFLLIILLPILIIAIFIFLRAIIVSFHEESFESETIIIVVGLVIAFILPVFIGIISSI